MALVYVCGALLPRTHCNAKVFVYGVVCTSLAMTWQLLPSSVPLFRFGDVQDAGITIYLCKCRPLPTVQRACR